MTTPKPGTILTRKNGDIHVVILPREQLLEGQWVSVLLNYNGDAVITVKWKEWDRKRFRKTFPDQSDD